MKVSVINGPNLDQLGTREVEIYGKHTLKDIENYVNNQLGTFGYKNIKCDWFQSNSEAEIIGEIHRVRNDDYSILVINPAAYTHTSVAILDSLKMLEIPIIEVHISNTVNREDFRSQKITTKSSSSVIEGMGHKGYLLAILGYLLEENNGNSNNWL